jgi:hypothetical protein
LISRRTAGHDADPNFERHTLAVDIERAAAAAAERAAAQAAKDAAAAGASGTAAGAGRAAAAGAGRAAARACVGGSSFTPSTPVLLASGKAVPISSLQPGDTVLATNTKTGKTSPEPVAAVEVNHDTDLRDLRVKTAHGVQIIHTTASHLFWDPYHHYWVAANKLSKGERLKTPDGTLAVADGGTTPKVHDGWMWDLTVPGNNDHDFYIAPAGGSTSILVHNWTCEELPSPFGSDTYAVFGRRGLTPADQGGDLNVARPWPGHEVLTLSRPGKMVWSIDRNDEWVAGIIAKRQPIYLASPIDDASLATSDSRFPQSIFARELNQVLNSGVPYNFSPSETYLLPVDSEGNYLVPVPRDG